MSALSTKANRLYPSLPNIDESLESHTAALMAVKDSIQTHERQDGNYLKSFVRFEELITLGIIDENGVFVLNVDAEGESSFSLDNLSDVTVSSPSDDAILGYDTATAEWIDQTAAQLGLSTTDHTHPPQDSVGDINLGDLGDVELAGAHSYDLLFRDTDGDWKPTEQLLQWDGSGLHLPSGDLRFYAVGDTASSALRQDYPASGDVMLQVLAGNIVLQAGIDVILDGTTSLIIESGQAIRWLDAEDAKQTMLRFTGGDPNFASVALLVDADGDDGATAYTERSDNAAVATFVGSGQLDTAQFKFGTASILLDGNSDYVTFPDTTAFTLGSEDFVIEGWVRLNSLPAIGEEMCMISQWSTGTSADRSFFVSLIRDGSAYRIRGGMDSNWEQGSLTGAPDLNVWIHWAMQRSGDEQTLWWDSKREYSAETFFGTGRDSTETVKLGVLDPAGGGDAGFLDGWIDDVRITIGATRYDFDLSNISVPTEAFPSEGAFFAVGNAGYVTRHLGESSRFYDVGLTDYVQFDHDGADFNISGFQTANINITDITSIQAGTVDVDFDDITATTYGGILEANLLDKIVAEVIEAYWTWSGTQAKIRFNQTDAAANNRLWEIGADNEQFALTLWNDAKTQLVDVFRVERTLNVADRFDLFAGIFAVWDSGKTDNITLEHDGNYGRIGGTNMGRLYFEDAGNYYFNSADNSVGFKIGIDATQIMLENSLAHTVVYWEDGDGNLYYTFNFGGINGEGFTIARGNKLTMRGTTGVNLVEFRHDNVDFNFTASNTTDFNISGITNLQLAANLVATGTVTGSNLNVANWDEAYGWGDHSVPGYLTSIPTHTGHVTGDTALALVVAAITGQTALTIGLASTDELLLSDAGVIKRMDISVIEAYMQANLSFLTSETSHADVLVDGDFTSNGIMTRTGAGVYAMLADASANWNAAYGWGDHDLVGYLTSQTSHADVLVDGDIGVTVQAFGAYLTSVQAGDVDAEASADGYVLTSDGIGNAAWEAVAGGSGDVTMTQLAARVFGGM